MNVLSSFELIRSEKNNSFSSLRMSSKLDKTFRTAQLSQLEHHSSFWARNFFFFFAPNELKTWQNVKNGSFKPFGASQLILSERKNAIFFAQNELKTWQKRSELLSKAIWSVTVHSELEKNNEMFVSLRMSSRLDKTFITAHLSHFEHHRLILSEKKQCNFVSLRMSSQLDKTFRMAHLSQLEHQSSFWAWENLWNMFSLRLSSKLDKTFRTAQLSHWEHRSSFWAREKQWQFVSLRMSSKLDKTFRMAQLSQLEHHSLFWAREFYEMFFRSEWSQNLTKH